MAFFGASDLLTSLFTCLPGGRHYKERQGKVTEMLSFHSKRGHAHNSGNQLSNLSHLRHTPWPIYLLLTPSLSDWKLELPPGKDFLRKDLLGHWEEPGKSEAARWHCSWKLSWLRPWHSVPLPDTDLTYMQCWTIRDHQPHLIHAERCMSLLIPQPSRKLHLEGPKVSLALETLLNPVSFVWNSLPKKRTKMN